MSPSPPCTPVHCTRAVSCQLTLAMPSPPAHIALCQLTLSTPPPYLYMYSCMPADSICAPCTCTYSSMPGSVVQVPLKTCLFQPYCLVPLSRERAQSRANRVLASMHFADRHDRLKGQAQWQILWHNKISTLILGSEWEASGLCRAVWLWGWPHYLLLACSCLAFTVCRNLAWCPVQTIITGCIKP